MPCMKTSERPLTDEEFDTEERNLRVELSVSPSAGCSCPLKKASEIDAEVDEVRRRISDDRCESDIVLTDSHDTKVINTTTRVDEGCFCPVFEGSEILPGFEGVGEDGVVVSLYISDRDEMKDVLEKLRSTARDLTLLRVGSLDGIDDAAFSDLTDKQRETLVRAVTDGYYDDPPGTTLDDLSDEFGVSKSAVSQRLNRAEAKVVTHAVDDG